MSGDGKMFAGYVDKDGYIPDWQSCIDEKNPCFSTWTCTIYIVT